MTEGFPCNSCGRVFSENDENSVIISIDSKQAVGCATYVFVSKERPETLEAISCYGSDYDTMRHFVKADRLIRIGELCDECLSKAIAAGWAKPDPSFFRL